MQWEGELAGLELSRPALELRVPIRESAGCPDPRNT